MDFDSAAYRIKLIVIPLLLLQPHASSGTLFDDYCMTPIGPGKGQLSEHNSICTVTFKARSSNDEKATEYCATSSPFDLRLAKRDGKKTICEYERPSPDCEGSDIPLDGKCYSVRGSGTFDGYTEGCGNYQRAELTNRDDIIWIVNFNNAFHDDIWTDNRPDSLESISPIWIKTNRKIVKAYGETKLPMKERPIKLRVKYQFDEAQVGQLIYAHEKEQHPYLCCRDPVGGTTKHGFESLVTLTSTFGFVITTAKDSNGEDRAFVIFHTHHAVPLKSEFMADMSKFHDICSALPNGYVASRYDFLNADEFRKVMEANKTPLVRTSIYRHGSTAQPYCNAGKKMRQEYTKTHRKKFLYLLPNQSVAEVPVSHWEDGFPMNQCADLPRLTVVMSTKGYRDMPATARLPVICTFGNPPNVRMKSENDVCAKHAHFDKSTGQCQCDDPQSDARVKYPKDYGFLPPGSLCVTCKANTVTKSVVFIIDGTGTVGRAGFEQQKKFAKQVFQLVQGMRAAFILLACPSKVLLPMAQYSQDDLERSLNSIEYKQATSTATYDAWAMAEKQFKGDKSQQKTLVVMSDGETSNCYGSTKVSPGTGSPSGEDEFKISERLNATGVNLLYLEVRVPKRSPGVHDYHRNVVWLTDKVDLSSLKDPNSFKSKKIIEVASYATLKDNLADTIEQMCNIEEN